ncbi:MAG TPA: glycine cleavage system aminomethyltransferase GcvT [Candidatus Gastranaerophilales bacterium]|nr:glycine cleavage system aminomethyltransferase GcvT [Candidatus Gastranaerophilales bacterium]
MKDQDKKTPLYQEHKALHAKMLSFAGWQMPLQYTSVKEEHLTVRNKAGIFDVSHMGQFFIYGKEALLFLQKLVPQDLTLLEEGKAVYSMLVNEQGGIIDDLIIYRLPDQNKTFKFLLIVNASRIENDLNRLLNKKNNYDLIIDNESDKLSMIALQGPRSSEILEALGLIQENQPGKFKVKDINLLNMDIIIARTGYTGEDGFELIVKNENAVKLWKKLLEKGENFGLKPIGYAARDTLRLEASLLLYGQDMDEKTTPVEASLNWTISKNKKENFSGKDIIFNQLLNKNINKKLIGFKMLDQSVPRHDYEIYIENQTAGHVTSGGFSPCGNIGVGLGYIDTQKPFTEGTKIDIMIRGKFHPAEIIKRPFYSKN